MYYKMHRRAADICVSGAAPPRAVPRELKYVVARIRTL